MGNIRCIIFDLDGTIVDSIEAHYLALNNAIKNILGIEMSFSFFETYFGIETYRLLDIFGRKMNIEMDSKLKKQISEFKNEIFKNYINHIKLNKDILSFLKYIRDKRIKTAIFTVSSREEVFLMLKNLKILHFFDKIVTKDDVTKLKPDPEGLFIILESLKVDRNDTIYIGDKEIDRETAKNAKISFYQVGKDFDNFMELVRLLNL